MIAKAKLTTVVGAGNVRDDEATLQQYSHDMSFVDVVKPACVVKPRNADDIETLVKLARKTQTPLVPVSSGPPHFRGDTIPSVGGAIVVDLSGMKKVVMVDRKN